jgi:acyl-CoA thioesterase FadM
LGDQHILEARMTTVCIKLEGMQPIPIPDDFRKSFEEILEVDEE